jgi:hypothetical protein
MVSYFKGQAQQQRHGQRDPRGSEDADWIFTVVSTTGLLLVVWLVLRPRS